MKKILSIITLFVLPFSLFGQGIDDALRYSQETPTGTARSMAMGNALVLWVVISPLLVLTLQG